MILRNFTNADLNAVLSIAQQVHSHPWTRGNFNDALLSGYCCRLAEIQGEIVAYAVILLGVDEAELLDIGVALSAQRQGVGRALLHNLRTFATGKTRMVLEVRASNAAARQFYSALSWKEIGRRRDYYLTATAREDAILMEWVF